MFKFQLLEKVKDTVTGYSGTIIARIEYSHGHPLQYLVTANDSTGRPVEWWLAEERLVSLDV